MHKTKALLTTLVASMVLTAVLSTVPARAAAVAADSEARVASLTKTAVTVHRQIDRLSRCASAAPHSASLRRHLVRTGRRVISLTRGVNGLNSYTLGLADVDEATYSALLGLNAQVQHVDRDAWRLSRKVLSRQHRSISRKISVLADHLRVLDGKVRDRLQEAPTPTPTPTPTAVPAQTFNVMDYGAKADGTIDDVAHIQAAINACSAAGGGTVYLPAGTYCLYQMHVFWPGNGGCLELKEGVCLVGAGAANTILKCTYTSGANIICAQNCSHIGIESLSSYHSGANGTADSIKMYRCTDVHISNVVLHNDFAGTNFIGCHDVLCENSLSYAQDFCGFGVSESLAIETTHGDNVAFSGCEACDCVVGFRMGGTTPLLYPDFASRVNNAAFVNCYAHDNVNNFLLTYASNATMSDCVAANASGTNVYLAGVETALIHNTTYSGTGGSAAYVATDCQADAWWFTNYGASSDIVED